MQPPLLSSETAEKLLLILANRFNQHSQRHPNLRWVAIADKLVKSPGKLWSLNEMERTGGQPDVVGIDESSGQYIFFDCSPESPSGRRSLCYDEPARLERKADSRPVGSAQGLAAEMGCELLTEADYRALQRFGQFDVKTSSWLQTPGNIRLLGGALFGDRRYDTVFIYHNGAQSYYAARGFRVAVRV